MVALVLTKNLPLQQVEDYLVVAILLLLDNLHHLTQEVETSVNSNSKLLNLIILKPTKQKHSIISRTRFLMSKFYSYKVKIT